MPVVVTHDNDGSIAAFENRCAHRGSLICLDDAGKGAKDFQCVYHAWRYDLRGNLQSVAFQRGVKGKGGMPPDFRVKDHGPRQLRVTLLHGPCRRRRPRRGGFAHDSPLEGDGFEPSVPHKKQPFLAAPVRSPQFAFHNKKRLFRARDRWFESISLQRGVTNEPRGCWKQRRVRTVARTRSGGFLLMGSPAFAERRGRPGRRVIWRPSQMSGISRAKPLAS